MPLIKLPYIISPYKPQHTNYVYKQKGIWNMKRRGRITHRHVTTN